MNKSEELVDFMAKACHYAQEHCSDPDAWSTDYKRRRERFQCISYQMACFLAHNTVEGNKGVEWNIIINDLVSINRDKNGMMVKSIERWKVILNGIAKKLGGWK